MKKLEIDSHKHEYEYYGSDNEYACKHCWISKSTIDAHNKPKGTFSKLMEVDKARKEKKIEKLEMIPIESACGDFTCVNCPNKGYKTSQIVNKINEIIESLNKLNEFVKIDK